MADTAFVDLSPSVFMMHLVSKNRVIGAHEYLFDEQGHFKPVKHRPSPDWCLKSNGGLF
jgi:hypothetical protein